MELNLTRPICFFDLETTGIDIGKDRIVEISILKIFPNGNKESKTWLVNPTIPIPYETTLVHGITNEKVANEPTFSELSSHIHKMIKDKFEQKEYGPAGIKYIIITKDGLTINPKIFSAFIKEQMEENN